MPSFERSHTTKSKFSAPVFAAAVLFSVLIAPACGNGELKVENRQFVFLCIITVALVFIFSPLCDTYLTTALPRALCICLICIIDVMVLFAEFGVFEKSQLQKENEIIERMLYMQQVQRRTFENNVEVLNRKCHDMRHQISMLKAMDDSGQRSEYISGLEKTLRLYDLDVKTGNRALDIVIAEYGMQCEQNGIRFTYMLDGESLSFMESSDVYSFFCNALENAVESLKTEKDFAKRFLEAVTERCSGGIVVRVENYFSGSLEFVGGLPRSTKGSSDWHGFGLKSVKYIAEKYGGNLSCRVKDSFFVLQAVFPCEPEPDGTALPK